MQSPVLRGIIDRRILVNYRVDPEVLAEILPEPFGPKLINGAGIAGICLIPLEQMRPRFLPPVLAPSSENAAPPIPLGGEHGRARRARGGYDCAPLMRGIEYDGD